MCAKMEVLSLLRDELSNMVLEIKYLVVGRNCISQLSTFLEEAVCTLEEITMIQSHDDFTAIIEAVREQVNQIRKIVKYYGGNFSKIYLLLNCRSILKPNIEVIAKQIGSALSQLSIAQELCRNLQSFEFATSPTEDEVLNEINILIRERNFTRLNANNLLMLIAEAVDIENDASTLKKEFDDFKNEVESSRKSMDFAHAVQMDQIVSLLEKADATLSFEDKEITYSRRRDLLGSRIVEPLQSFYCPITGEIMLDPVELSSGHTFERKAIEKWIKDGNFTCPLTMKPLDGITLRANTVLKKSIEEWKERNTIIRIASIKTTLTSGEDEEIVKSLRNLLELCEEKELNREFVVLENLIKILVELLGKSNRLFRNYSLAILNLLAKDSNDIKGLIADVDNSTELIVRSLARKSEERKSAVALLLQLVQCEWIRDKIGSVNGCILLLVTISNSDSNQTSSDAKKLLEVLSSCEGNVVHMAKANYFNPLIKLLSSGSDDVRKKMVSALSEMELTDQSKDNLFKNGVLLPLLNLISHDDTDIKIMAIQSIQNISSLHYISIQVIREHAVPSLIELLHQQSASASILRELAANTVMCLAKSLYTVKDSESVVFLDSDKDISWLFSLIITGEPTIQRCIIQTFYCLVRVCSAKDMRMKLRQFSAIRVLIQHCEHPDLILRANAVKLLSCLIDEDEDDNHILEANVNNKLLNSLTSIFETSKDDEELAASMGIISKLPLTNNQVENFEALTSIVNFLTTVNLKDSSKTPVIENAIIAICKLTASSNQEAQKKAAKSGIIPILVHMLRTGTSLTKKHAALSLAQFSENSLSLAKSIEKQRRFFCCTTAPEHACRVHSGVCSVETSYCLLEAEAVEPLIKLLEEGEHTVSEAALKALSTLVEGNMLQNGSRIISEMKGIMAIIQLMSTSQEIELQENILRILERIFQLEEHKKVYGGLVQMNLVDIAQRGSGTVRALAARILSYLDVLHDQSSYF